MVAWEAITCQVELVIQRIVGPVVECHVVSIWMTWQAQREPHGMVGTVAGTMACSWQLMWFHMDQ